MYVASVEKWQRENLVIPKGLMKKWMQTGGGGRVVNFYYGIPRVWKDNAIWKF